jgi:hypothetical protein
MRILAKSSLALCAVILCSAVLAPHAKADNWDRMTVVNFSGPVEIPGQVLPPGTYVFKLVALPDTRNVVLIQSEDRSYTYAMLQTINTWRSEPPEHTHFLFYERPSDQPPALETWYYPGDTRGLDFIYPGDE